MEPPIDIDGEAQSVTLHGRFATGELIGERFEVVSLLGQGGMATVYKVRDLKHDGNIVALKLITPEEILRSSDLLGRFIRELQVGQKLDHPNIANVYDHGRTRNGFYFISMEFVDGVSLDDHIKQNILEFNDVIRILYQLASALAYAHSQEVVHRDLKPANVLLTRAGDVKLVDFGLARNISREYTLTPDGVAVGTSFYMSPEQLAGKKDIDGRTDIYALGIMAYEMVTGKRPFDVNTRFGQDGNPTPLVEIHTKVATKHYLEELPGFENARIEVPKWFELFVRVCAEKESKRRFQSMTEVTDVLNKRMRKLGLTCDPPLPEKVLARLINHLFRLD